MPYTGLLFVSLSVGLTLAGMQAAYCQTPPSLRLWYREPATVPGERETGWSWQNSRAWTRALPVGNGRLGGMVFGGVPVERIQLNEISLWSGWPQDADNPDAAVALPEIRRLLFEGKYVEAQKLTFERLVCRGPGSGHGNGAKGPYGSYETLGDLRIAFDRHEPYTDYRRELDLNTAIASVVYRAGGATYRREVLASAPLRALVVRLTCDRPRSLTFTVRLTRPECYETTADGPRGLKMSGVLSDGRGMRYTARLRAVPQGGRVEVAGDKLRVENANAVTLLLCAATSYQGQDPDRVTADQIGRAEAKGYEVIRSAHIQDYQALFRRVSLTLNGPDHSTIPTDERLAAYAAGQRDVGLEVLYFQFGRYLLISSSRPGGLPANLQGIWSESIQTPWNGDYHHNINDQMNYWPAETTALPECHEPFLKFIASLVEPGRRTAKIQYGLDGWVVHTISNVWGFTSPGEHPSWGQFPCAGAWLCRHLWEHYLFNGDRKFLEWAYPIMRESARFFLGFLVEEPKHGWLVTAPSNSPENSFRTPDGQVASVCYGPTMDMSILRDLFGSVAQAARILARDPDLAERLDAARARLAPLQIGRHGQLQEWIEDFEETEPGHRHISHLYGLHPGAEITVRGTPELAKAARVSLERRLAAGGGHTGWSRAWIVNLFARLEDGEKAYEHFRLLLSKSTLPNLFDNHPPFQIDGNFGGTAGVAEMLLQSHAGEVVLLPALPQTWPTGRVTGLRARGGLSVSLTWADGRLADATLTAERDNGFVVRYKNNVRELHLRKGQSVHLSAADFAQ